MRALAAVAMSDNVQLELGELYREHADFVWRVLLRLGIPEAHAEDVAHEVFLVVRQRLPDYDGHTPFRAWLHGIARRVAANVRRSHQRTLKRIEIVQPPADPRTPEEHVQRSQAATLVARFLETLSESQREVFVLIDIEGMTGPEVARALSSKLNSVYSRLRMARERFAAFTAGLEIESPRQETT